MTENNELKPSQLLKLKTDLESEDLIREIEQSCREEAPRVNPHIEALEEHKHEPLEVDAYLKLNKEDEYLTTAVYAVYYNLKQVLYKDYSPHVYEDHHLRFIEELNSGTKTYYGTYELEPEADCPTLLKSLFYLKRHLINDNKYAAAEIEDLYSIDIHLRRELNNFNTTKEELVYIKKRCYQYTQAYGELKGKQFFSTLVLSQHRFLKSLLEKKETLEELIRIENSVDNIVQKVTENSSANESKEKRGSGGTKEQSLLTMYFLLEYLNAKGKNINKAKFISFLTGYSAKKIEQEFPKILIKANDNFTLFENNAKEVRQHFEALGLIEIVKMIDNELSSLRNDL